MAFGLGPKVVKHCPKGHVMQMTWRTCPRCSGRAAGEPVLGRDMADATIILNAPPAPEPDPPPPDWTALLTVESGPAAGRSFEVRPGRWKFGRAPTAEPDFELTTVPEPGMSRDHFALEVGTAAVVLRDLGSTNGTFVNGKRAERHILQEGDLIQAGGTAMRVRLSLGDA